MSRYHANVIWQSSDGTWNRAFYEVSYRPDDPDDEWGVEFDHDTMWWASCGHATEAAAAASWDGANPGSHDNVPYSDEHDRKMACLRLDALAGELEVRESRRPNNRYNPGMFHGASRINREVGMEMLRRSDKRVRDLDRQQHQYRLDGYANDNTRAAADEIAYRSEVKARLLRDGLVTDADLEGLGRVDALDRRNDLERLKRDYDERRAASAARGRYSWGQGDPYQRPERREAYEKLCADIASNEAFLKAAGLVDGDAGSAHTPGTQPRVQRGVPAGGQFATKQHPESRTTL